MTVCDYTARVDRPFKNPAQREFAQLRNISAIVEVRTKGRRSRGNCRHNERGFDYGCVSLVLLFQGFVFSSDYEQGQSLASEREYKQHEGFYQRLIEIARRHKIMNPEKMRGEYGKLLYLLQDSVSSNMQSQLGFSFITGISTGTVTRPRSNRIIEGVSQTAQHRIVMQQHRILKAHLLGRERHLF